jgi:hypothetical protein
MMALVMLQEVQRQFIRAVMRTMVHEQVPGIGNQRGGEESAP